MSDKIKKGLEICSLGDENQCWQCPYVHEPNNSCLSLPKDALAYIIELEAKLNKAKSEARKEIIQILREKSSLAGSILVGNNVVNNLLEEMEREDNA